MRTALPLSIFLTAASLPLASAQHFTPREIVTAVFDKMRAADTTGLRAFYHPQARAYSVTTAPDGAVAVVEGDRDRWFAGIAQAAPGSWDERAPYTEVRTDGHLATAWVPYVFYYEGAVHHCGTNAFQLVRAGADAPWQILHTTDTRRDGEGDCAELPATRPDPVAAIDSLASRWHRAAAQADSAAYFGAMTDDAYYLGTDPGEHWTKAEFTEFAAQYFRRESAWDFAAAERHVFHDEDAPLAYWDEVLDTWMGKCRGTGVVERAGDGTWRIKHYTLSMLVPNERTRDVMRAVAGGE